MPRELTESHKRKMQRGRERMIARRERSHRLAIIKYEEYVARDARLYAAFLAARERYGYRSQEADDARLAWRENIATCPPWDTLPDDKTWRRLTGRAIPEDDR